MALFGHQEEAGARGEYRSFDGQGRPSTRRRLRAELYIEYAHLTQKAAEGAQPGKKADLVERLMDDAMPVKFDTLSEEVLVDMCKNIRLTQDSLFVQRMANEQDKLEAEIQTKKPSKWKEITIKSILYTPTDFSPAGTPQVSAAVLRKMSGSNLFGDPKDAVYGGLYDAFGGGDAGREACEAVGALAMVGQIDATITNFLVATTLVDEHPLCLNLQRRKAVVPSP